VQRLRYHFTHREQLERFMNERTQRWLRRNVPAGHLEIGQPNFREVEPSTFEVCWTLQFSSKFGMYSQLCEMPEELLVELHAMIGQLLDLKPATPEVKVVIEQRRPRRAKRRPSPAQELEDKSEVALTPEERAIHRRMLEGR
jgi:hypothetical protein